MTCEKENAAHGRADPPQAVETAKVGAASLSRRRVIKSTAVALPMILTLRNGTAQAMTSFNACFVKGKALATSNNPRIGIISTDPRDTVNWLRSGQRVPGGQNIVVASETLNPSNRWFCIGSGSNCGLTSGRPSVANSPNWWRGTWNARNSYPTAGTRPQLQVLSGRSPRALVYVNVDNAGNITVTTTNPSPSAVGTGSPITLSCWTSLLPGSV